LINKVNNGLLLVVLGFERRKGAFIEQNAFVGVTALRALAFLLVGDVFGPLFNYRV